MTSEVLVAQGDLPLNINLIELGEIYANWHKELKIIYVLQGTVFLDIKLQKFKLKQNDFIVINSYDFLSIQSDSYDKSVILEFLIDCNYINRLYPNFSYMQFSCNSQNSNIIEEKYDKIRFIISKLINYVLKEQPETKMLSLSTLLELCLFLVNNFRVEETINDKKISNKYRLIKILNFLDENYDKEDLDIEKIANHMKLSPQYILKIFRKNFSMGLTDYLNSLRLKKSLSDLLYTNKSILEIAIDYGFNDNKSYHRIFKREYGTTPGEFRKVNINNDFNSKNKSSFKNKTELLLELSCFHLRFVENTIMDNKTESILIDFDFSKVNKKRIYHNWKRIISLGKATEGLNGDIQYQLKEVKRDINPQYVRFTGIFNDEMHIYNEDSEGNIYYNFAYADKLLDFIVHENMKPYINIGFMPKKLAGKEEYVFISNTNVSYPKSMKKWKNMVESFISHLIDRYGEQEVSSWYFEIWNNPDLYRIYWYESPELFYSFFKETFYSIKGISKKLNVGGSGCASNSIEWIEKFLYSIKDLEPDFFSYNNYSIKMNIINPISIESVEFEKPSVTNKIIKTINSMVKTIFKNKPEIIISEWNLNPIPNDFLNDTCYASSYIIENVLDNFELVNDMVYWTFTENKVGTDIFYGGLGLFTTNNLKKASYNAFLLLNKLGNDCISRGKNHFITSKENSFQILLYNYEDYKTTNKSKEIQINISNFSNGTYILTKYFLDTSSGSIYDSWMEMGSPKKITEDIYQVLKSKEKMNMKIEEIYVDNVLIVKEIVPPNGAIFIEIKNSKTLNRQLN